MSATDIGAAFCVLVLVYCVVALYRLRKVDHYVHDLINRVSSASQRDIAYGREWKWRYDRIDKVPYEEMVFKVWRRLKSFVPDEDEFAPRIEVGDDE